MGTGLGPQKRAFVYVGHAWMRDRGRVGAQDRGREDARSGTRVT